MTIRLPTSESPAVSIVVLATRRGERFRACLQSLTQSLGEGPSAEVVVVLNDAADDVRAVMDEVSGARYLTQTEDLGTAGSWNRAVAATTAPRVAIVHEDARPQPGWLAALSAVMDDDPTVAVAGATLLNPDGSLQNRGWITWDNGCSWPIRQEFFGTVPEDPLLLVDAVSSATSLVDRAHWDEVGGFDERFFPAVGVDVDLGWSAWARARAVVSVGGACSFHDTGAMVQTGAGAAASQAQRRYLIARSERLVSEKWGAMLDHGCEPQFDGRREGPPAWGQVADRRARRHRHPGAPPRSSRWLTGPVDGRAVTLAEIEERAAARRRELLDEVGRWAIEAHDSLFAERDTLLAEAARLRSEVAERDALSAEAARLRSEVAELRRELDARNELADHLSAEVSGLAVSVADLEARQATAAEAAAARRAADLAAELSAVRATRTWRLHDAVTARLAWGRRRST